VRDLRLRVASNWLAPQSFPGLIVLHLTLSHDGALLNSEVRESSGSKRFDDKVLASVKATQFAPLPEWYHGNSLDIDLKLDTITQ
jgi:TonB family protein